LMQCSSASSYSVASSLLLGTMAACSHLWRSKLGNKYAKSDIDRWDAQLKSDLSALRRSGGNSKCFDCGASDATWASPKLGIFVCVSCSDVHRAAGAHITCVKNFSTYLWGPDEVALMKSVGNKNGRELYGNITVQPCDTKQHKVDVCTAKYGNPKAQKVIEAQIAAATAIVSYTGQSQSSQPRESKAEVVEATSNKQLPVMEARSLFDEMFGSDVKPAEAPTARNGVQTSAVAMKACADSSNWFDDLFLAKPVVPLTRRAHHQGQHASLESVEAEVCTAQQTQAQSSVPTLLAQPVQAGVAKAKLWTDSTSWFDELFSTDSPDQVQGHSAVPNATVATKATDTIYVKQSFTSDALDDLIFEDFAHW